ncbi:MAG: aldo/keto reductase [Bacteroidales bacterium]
MEYRYLGNTGLKISALSLGSWVTFADQLDVDAACNVMKTAFDFGVNFFDNAEAYAQGRSETVMGQAIKKAGWKRSDLVLSTKIYWGGNGPNDKGLSRKHIIEGTLASLERLQTSYVDLIFCHRPDLHTPIEETVRAMNYLINQGLAFYWGTSEWNAEQIRQAYEIARREHLIGPDMEQPQYNMFYRQRMEVEYLPLFNEFKMGTTIWSPLASGILTGKYNDIIPENSRLAQHNYKWIFDRYNKKGELEKTRKLTALATESGIPMAQMALAWCLKNQNVSTVITGSTSVEQTIQNMKALEIVGKLNQELMQKIEEILDNKPALEEDWREK